MKLRCAVLDDFQGVATTMADWSVIADEVEVVSFTEHFATEEELAAAIDDCEIVVTLRERVPFPSSLLARLPRLRLLIHRGRATRSSTTKRPRSVESSSAARQAPARHRSS